MSSNDYHRLKLLTSRYQPRALCKKSSQAALMNEDLSPVIEDIPRHNFMKTVTLGSKSVGRLKGTLCMQIVDHEEMVEEEPVEDECVIEDP